MVQPRHLLLLALVGAFSGCSPGAPGPFIGVGTISVTLPGGATSIALDASGATAVITASETGYSGTFKAASSNTAVATVSPASANAAFTVTAVASGTATISISDTASGVTKVPVTVTTASGVISIVR